MGGRFYLDLHTPVVNGMPHYSTATNGHLWYMSDNGRWILRLGFSPELKDSYNGAFKTEGAVPVGKAVWQYKRTIEDRSPQGRSLALAEMSTAETAEMERAADAVAAAGQADSAAQGESVRPQPCSDQFT